VKNFIIASAITLLSTAAIAHDKVLGESSEYESSPLVDHGQSKTSSTLPRNHDHGDDTVNNFVGHDHDRMMAEHHPAIAQQPTVHDHGDNTSNNFVEHEHN